MPRPLLPPVVNLGGLRPAFEASLDLWPRTAQLTPANGALAGQYGLAPSYFIRLYHAAMGLPPRRSHLTQQFDRAQRLLRLTRKLEGRIAAACGFETYPHFSLLFHCHVGLGPRAYRQRFHEEPG
ncbi:MAG: helix-turn-helix transcriptional regulator [Spirochaetes bacterium]|nr:helix-turn-helix transcriptional regulator [Spirochaetota bacterium]